MKEIDFLKNKKNEKIACFFVATLVLLVVALSISYKYYYINKELKKEVRQIKKSQILLKKSKKSENSIKIIPGNKTELSNFLSFMEIINQSSGSVSLNSAIFDKRGIHLLAIFSELSDVISFSKSISKENQYYQIEKIKSGKDHHVDLYFKRKSGL